MARNRKNESAALRFGSVLKAGLICVAIVLCCVGYVWQKKQIHLLADQIRRQEKKLTEKQYENSKLKGQLNMLLRPEYLESRIKELNLGLTQPKPSQMLFLTGPSAKPAVPSAASAEPRQYAADQTGKPGQTW